MYCSLSELGPGYAVLVHDRHYLGCFRWIAHDPNCRITSVPLLVISRIQIRAYYRQSTGWCQFLKLCKARAGRIIQFTPETQGLPVDVYGFHQATNSCHKLDLCEGLVELQDTDLVAVMAKDHEFLKGVKTITMNTFMDLGNLAGATTIL